MCDEGVLGVTSAFLSLPAFSIWVTFQSVFLSSQLALFRPVTSLTVFWVEFFSYDSYLYASILIACQLQHVRISCDVVHDVSVCPSLTCRIRGKGWGRGTGEAGRGRSDGWWMIELEGGQGAVLVERGEARLTFHTETALLIHISSVGEREGW